MDEKLLNSSDDVFMAGMAEGESHDVASLATSTEPAVIETTTIVPETPVETEQSVSTTLDPATTTTVASEENTNEQLTDEEKAALAEAKPANGEAAQPETAFDYKAAYERITAPFKANGKDIVLKTPDEVIQMMQMGANYTRKMQSIAPHRKALMMLQNNELLDEDKLSYLIDLNKKDPAAIQKFLKDSGVDPLEVDINADSTYQPGNHHISDEDVALTAVLEDVASTQEGRETVQTISAEWDQASKEMLKKDPNVITVINEQRQNGVYDAITTEIERQRIIGAIPLQTSFLEAYRLVGTQLYGSASKEHKAPPAPIARTIPTSMANNAANTEKIQATAPAKSVGKATAKIDPLSMSDSEFEKFMESQV